MRFNKGAANPEPHARAMGFGGEERIKDLVRLLSWPGHPSLADRD
jgi:hypothetical protein